VASEAAGPEAPQLQTVIEGLMLPNSRYGPLLACPARDAMARRCCLGGQILRGFYIVAALSGAMVVFLSSCVTQYEQRDFAFSSEDTAWGSMFVNVITTGDWNEHGVKVSGSPYQIVFAPRLKEEPGQDCKLSVTSLYVRLLNSNTPLFKWSRIDLTAGPINPNEPNERYYSKNFIYVPVENAYMASATTKGINLEYAPARLDYVLLGSRDCPQAVRGTHSMSTELLLRPMKGSYTWLDVIGGV
jgi:hypothetical protein